MPRFSYSWSLSNGYPASNGLKVFGTFICGGGSTMGYKLAGFNHLGGVEIDPKIAEVYKVNHAPKYLFNEDIREFLARERYPEELYNLDILDGSPPCSSFSMSGNREKDWNKKKVFKEGQAKQRLDDLFFNYIELAKKLQPKVIIAENVKGLLQGNAKGYVIRIKKEFEEAGYKVQLFLLNAASMGVPQKRERVFFICHRKDLKFPKLNLNFNEKAIPFKEIEDKQDKEVKLQPCLLKLYDLVGQGEAFSKYHPKGNYFNFYKAHPNKVLPTIIANLGSGMTHYKFKRMLNSKELMLASSFPVDYNFLKVKPKYLMGMSVPPIMTASIADKIYKQWFKV